MNEKSFAVVEKAMGDYLRKRQGEFNYFRDRLIKAGKIRSPDQQMVSAAIRKVNCYAVEIDELEEELKMLRVELGMEEDTDQMEEQSAE